MKHKSIQINQIPKPAKVSWLLVLFLIQTMIYGQGRNERVTIVGAFEPNLRPATKILINPAEQAFVADTSNQPYTNIGPKYSTAVSMPAIAWSQVKTDERPQFNRNYLDAALGSRLSPRFLFSHHSKLSKKTGFDLNLQHQSSWTDIQDFAPSSWMHNNAAVATASATGNYVWTNRLFYDHRLVHFYGFEPADFPTAVVEAADIRQQYQLASLSSQLKSNDKQSDALHHEIGFQYHYWQDRFSNREQLVTVKGNANKSLDLLQVDGAQEFAADAQFDFLSADDSLAAHRGFTSTLRPSFSMSGSFYQLEAALLASFGSDTAFYFHLHPFLSGKLFVFDDKLNFYASFGGERLLHYNMLATADNPYLAPGTDRWWTNTTHDFRAGVRTSLFRKLDLHAGIRYQQLEHAALIINDSTSAFGHLLIPVFDDYKLFRLQFEAGYHFDNQLSSLFTLSFDDYQMTSQAKPWHLPAVSGTLQLTYQLDETWKLGSTFHFMGARSALFNNQIYRLKPAPDLNMQANYRISDALEVYARLENVFNNRYEPWLNYPVQGSQLFGGITLKF